uniref:Cell wall-binding repeat-containing protein n=1 Tax=Bifidobacterium asteroides TaxID=1684 RepID=A0ABS3ISM7_9BIFI
MSKVKTSLPLKLGAGLICGATLIACVGALTVPARAAESKCGDDNTLEQCVTDTHLRSAVKTSVDTLEHLTPGTTQDNALIKDIKDEPLNLRVDGQRDLELAGLKTFTKTKSLTLTNDNLRDLSELKDLVDLETLDLSKNPIVYGLSQLGNKTNLKSLTVDGNGTQFIDGLSAVGSFTSLTKLSLKNQKLTDISALSNLDKLTELNLENNKISDVTPLGNLSALKSLILNHNNIKDITPLLGSLSLSDRGLNVDDQLITVKPDHEFDKKADWVLDGVKVGSVYANIAPESIDPAVNVVMSADNSKVTWTAPANYDSVSYNFAANVSAANNTKLGTFSGTVKQNRSVIQRLSGNDRYDTMGEIVEEAYGDTSGGTVIVASGDNFPDALASSGLSGLADAPVILTNSYRLSARADGQISHLNPTKVVVIGGKSAVSDSVVNQIEKRVAREAKIVRISGDTRRDTANEIFAQAKKQVGANWNGDTAIIATGENFTDALSISAYAQKNGYPVFLSGNTGLDASTVKDIKGYGFTKIVIAGGSAAVPNSVIAQLKGAGVSESNIVRLGGATRYQTSLEIAKYAASRDNSEALKPTTPVFATGENFPDALAGGVLAGVKKVPLVLVSPNTAVNHDALNWINSTNSFTKTAYVLGGLDAVSGTVSADISSVLNED